MHHHGLEVLGSGAILTGLVFGAVGAFIIDKKLTEASAFAPVGAALAFFGFMQGESVGIAVTPSAALAHAVVAAFLYALSRYPDFAFAPKSERPAAPAPAE